MNKITAGHADSQSLDVVTENIEKLKALFPTIVREGKLDVEELKALLGDYVETGDEFYRFTWAGKAMARQEANKPSTATLRPNKEESKDWDTTENIFIEGDNLEVLKLLQKSYASKIKMIYIDPPYNTGKDFVYKDNYADNLGNYLAITGQTDEEGRKLGTNSDTDGRYHSNWLNMMYPRLKLARNLLKDDGVIFISIDDNEVQNLRKICDEIFGEENFVSSIIWEKRYSPQNAVQWFSEAHDFILVYAKIKETWQPNLLERSDEMNARYRNLDNDPRGEWKPENATAQAGHGTASQFYELTAPNGLTYNPPTGRCWVYTNDRMQEMIADNRVWFGSEGKSAPSIKRFLTEVKQGIACQTIWKYEDVGHNQEGKKEIKTLFPEAVPFDTPKPTRLINRIVKLSTPNESDDIILDFFSGSATTAHASIQLNAEDGGTRKFIMVQLPESTDEQSDAFKSGYKNISEIGRERIRRAGEKIKAETKTDLFSDPDKKLDIGFKAFKLDSSNINAWDGSIADFERNLFNSADNIKSGRTEEDVLYEILLKNGLDLTLPITTQTVAGKTVYNIGEGALFICLANGITTAVAEGIGQWKETLQPATCKVIFKDNGFTDVEKTNSIQILKRYGILEVNSI